MAEKKEAQQQPIIIINRGRRRQKTISVNAHTKSIAPVVVDPATRWTIG